jgi:hypothetical protein
MAIEFSPNTAVIPMHAETIGMTLPTFIVVAMLSAIIVATYINSRNRRPPWRH